MNHKEQLFQDMNYKTISYFLSSTLIIGLLYTNGWFDVSYTFRQFLGFIFLILYFVGTIILVQRLILKDRKLRKHLLVRLSVLLFIALIIVISQWLMHKQNDRLGAGYLLYFELLGFGIPLIIYTAIESVWLLAKKKYAALCIDLFLVMGIYCLVIFSSIFGF
ncbi:hypothetical protein [Sphingobacterium sp. HMA12]|uniref:hypothetical protein n=1 Tax=Sphingobacterium sp. HMA12 TaxID=2050894 RepID=UPI000CE9D5CF|nr:hypothetical protein [Sphingobacterium sp. HMA12]